jgi:pimeloyl-ACP methyl ester carboxylesterase
MHALLSAADEAAAAAALGERLLLMHAEGDEQVPIGVSRELHAAAPGSRLIAVPGGDHRSIQHDPELTAVAVRFLTRALRPRPAAA